METNETTDPIPNAQPKSELSKVIIVIRSETRIASTMYTCTVHSTTTH